MKLKCLIIDDEPVARKVLQEFIEDIDWLELAGQAENPLKAMRLLREQEIDILFLDINMPVMNGWDLLHALQKDCFNKTVYVVIVSSSIDAADKKKAFSFSKVIDFVEKPFDEIAIEKLKSKLPWL